MHSRTLSLSAAVISILALVQAFPTTVVAFTCATPTDGSVLQLCDGFDTSPLNMGTWQFSGTAAAAVTTSVARSGAGSVRFHLDAQSQTTYRDELVAGTRGEFNIGEDYCINYSIRADNWTNVPVGVALFQTHAVPRGGDWATGCKAGRNPLSLIVQDTTNTLEFRAVNNPRTYLPGDTSSGVIAGFVAHSTPFVQGRWYDYTFHYKPSFGADGVIEAWLNGTRVYSYTGGNMDSTDRCGRPADPYVYLKIGIYKDQNDTGSQTTYADNVMVRRITNGGTCGPLNEPPASVTPPPTSTTCTNLQTSTATIPQGYGAAYNTLTTTKEYLVSAACTSATQANVTVGNGNSTTYVYNKGYYYTGSTWQQFTLSCSNLVSNQWCVERGTVTVPTPQNPTNVIGYTCQWNGTEWKCGCRDATCPTTARYWQLQRVGR